MRQFRIRDADLEELIARGHESKDLEHKGPMAWPAGDKRACCELVKDILALANHDGGGYLVIGVAETEDGRFEPRGLNEEQLKSFETTRLNEFVNSYARPPINATLRKVTHEARRFVIIAVPTFPDMPHICVKDFPGVLTAPTLYIRTDDNASAPISRSTDLQDLVESAIRRRSDKLLESFRTILRGSAVRPSPSAEERFAAQIEQAERRFSEVDPYAQKGYEGYLEVILHPAVFDAERFGLAQLRAAAEAAHVLYRGWSFMYTTDRSDQMYVLGDARECSVHWESMEGDTHTFWRLHRSGLLFHRRLMYEEADREAKYLDFVGFTHHVAEALDCLVRLYTSFNVEADEEIAASFRLTGSKGRTLTTRDSGRMWYDDGQYICQAEPIETSHSKSFAEWRAGRRDHAVAVAREVFMQFNWECPSPEVLRDIVDKVLDRRL